MSDEKFPPDEILIAKAKTSLPPSIMTLGSRVLSSLAEKDAITGGFLIATFMANAQTEGPDVIYLGTITMGIAFSLEMDYTENPDPLLWVLDRFEEASQLWFSHISDEELSDGKIPVGHVTDFYALLILQNLMNGSRTVRDEQLSDYLGFAPGVLRQVARGQDITPLLNRMEEILGREIEKDPSPGTLAAHFTQNDVNASLFMQN